VVTDAVWNMLRIGQQLSTAPTVICLEPAVNRRCTQQTFEDTMKMLTAMALAQLTWHTYQDRGPRLLDLQQVDTAAGLAVQLGVELAETHMRNDRMTVHRMHCKMKTL
jgi:hypothetical protein